jgi:hypothetical protein
MAENADRNSGSPSSGHGPAVVEEAARRPAGSQGEMTAAPSEAARVMANGRSSVTQAPETAAEVAGRVPDAVATFRDRSHRE